MEKEGRVEILRFANRVPLVYQQGACAITHALEAVPWKNYSLTQTAGGGVPVGPAVILVHVASTNIPFTSESKDAVADVPEILTEVDLGLKEVARKLAERFGFKCVAITLRENPSVLKNTWTAIAYHGGQFDIRTGACVKHPTETFPCERFMTRISADGTIVCESIK